KPCTVEKTGTHSDQASIYRVTAPEPDAEPVIVALRVARKIGHDGGGAITEPVALDCTAGHIELGDWSKNDGLSSYSGAAWYRRTITLTPDQARGRVTLKLGNVAASAEVRVNGTIAGTLLAAPWEVDITKQVKAGDNRIEIEVCNTLANHYQTIPTNYRGSATSGLMGPVSIEMQAPVTLTGKE
ncbi:MAG TPA: hypothetical protein PLA90_16690, partial [Candidatus Sumerlaeota bacterium]|nr:hypothetical protein [Candidatus Sumerlaeota bacterium]